MAVLFALAALIVGAFPRAAQGEPRYISTLAGNGIAGINGDGLPPLKAALYLPQDGVYGPDGNLYFCDWNNHRIRRIANDKVETIVGTGELGDAPDGVATQIKLNHPTGLCFDHQGRLIVAAWHNSKVKRLDLTTGMIENIAGTGQRAYGGDSGPGNLAKFDLPSSVCADSDDNIIISDQANFRIRRLGKTDGNITTIGGIGIAGYFGDDGPAVQAMIRSPVGQSAPPAGRLELDSQNRIFIADTGNHAIRRIDTDGTIHTVAGTGMAGYSGDNGPATQAKLNTPSDVAVAPDGTLYIADTMNSRVRKVTLDGTITTIAGTGVAGFRGDGGLGTDAKLDRPYGVAISPTTGEVVIADTHNHRLRILTEDPRDTGPIEEQPPVVIVPCTGEVGSICTYAGTGFSGFNGEGKDRQQCDLYWPIDMEFTPSGRTYILDWNNHKVREVQIDGRIVTVMGTDFVGDGPLDLSDKTAPGAPGLTVDLNHPTDLQEFPNGDLLVVAWHNHKFRQLDPKTGLVRILAGGPVGFAGDNGPAMLALLNQPPHGVLDPAGNFVFIDQRNQRLRLIKNFAADRENAIVSTVAGTGTPGFNGDGKALETQVSFPTGTNPEPSGGLARASNGVYYFSDTLNHRIRRLEFMGPDFTDGRITTIAGTGTPGYGGDGGPASAAQINYPEDMEVGPEGKLYFADTNNNRVRRIDLQSAAIELVAGTGERSYGGDGGPAFQAKLNRPFGIAFDRFGNLYISDTFNSRIRKVKLTTVPEGPDPILPADYSASYVEVRDCRFSLEHGGVYIRVLASPEAAQKYQDNVSPLPVGTVIVKEEYTDAQCEASELVRWRAMRKEPPGFDTQDGDWHWQWLTPRREVVYDAKATCITCHLQPDCLRRDYMCTLPGTTGMKLVLDKLPATLVSISGAPPDAGHNHGSGLNFDVYAVGADPNDGRGPFVLRYDHEAGKWRRLETGAHGDLWWISDHLIDGDFYMCGADGLILRFTPATQRFERMQTPGGKILFGIWGTDRANLWAVGGDLTDEDAGGVVWRWNGTDWAVDGDAALARPGGLPTLYKVWGRSADDIYVVGRLGVALHWSGVSWSIVPTGVTRPLFTVHGNDTRVAATGGFFRGVLLELEGNAFVDHAPASASQMNGVFLSTGPAVAVGAEGTYAMWGAAGWDFRPPVTGAKPLDFHGCWIDAVGGIWAVGGDLTIDKSYGVLGYAGLAGLGADFISETPCAPGAAMGQPGAVSFQRDVAPIFAATGCLASSCHGGSAPASEYDQRSYKGMFGAGQEARSFGMCDIVPGNPGASFLLEKLNPDPRSGVRMPNGLLPLTNAQIDLVYTWILQGAVEDTPPERPFLRGDANDDGDVNITDAIAWLGYFFRGDPSALDCDKAGDFDGDGIYNVTDAISLLGFLFLSNPLTLPAPFPFCGNELTRDDLTCGSSKCQP